MNCLCCIAIHLALNPWHYSLLERWRQQHSLWRGFILPEELQQTSSVLLKYINQNQQGSVLELQWLHYSETVKMEFLRKSKWHVAWERARCFLMLPFLTSLNIRNWIIVSSRSSSYIFYGFIQLTSSEVLLLRTNPSIIWHHSSQIASEVL